MRLLIATLTCLDRRDARVNAFVCACYFSCLYRLFSLSAPLWALSLVISAGCRKVIPMYEILLQVRSARAANLPDRDLTTVRSLNRANCSYRRVHDASGILRIRCNGVRKTAYPVGYSTNVDMFAKDQLNNPGSEKVGPLQSRTNRPDSGTRRP